MTEERLQQDIYLHFHNSYPDLRGLLCYNLNNSKNKIDGSRNRSLGLQPGRSDLVFYYSGMAHHIEIKLPEGRQSDAQKRWQQLIEKHGFKYYVIRSLDEFKELLKCIM